MTTAATSGAPGTSTWAGLQRWARRDEVRRAVSLVALMVTVAVVTGPSEPKPPPYGGLGGSLSGSHAIPFYVLAVVLAVVALFGGRWTAAAVAPVRQLRERGRGVVIPKYVKL